MDPTGTWTVIGAFIGFLGAVTPQWLSAKGSRKQKQADLQEQTIKDLQDVLAGLEHLAIFASSARISANCSERKAEAEVERTKASVERTAILLQKQLDTFQAYTAAKRRAEILTSRVKDKHARKLATEMIDLCEARRKRSDDQGNYEWHVTVSEKFTSVNNRLGEVLRGLH